jgi:hypothetical protein
MGLHVPRNDRRRLGPLLEDAPATYGFNDEVSARNRPSIGKDPQAGLGVFPSVNRWGSVMHRRRVPPTVHAVPHPAGVWRWGRPPCVRAVPPPAGIRRGLADVADEHPAGWAVDDRGHRGGRRRRGAPAREYADGSDAHHHAVT